MAAGNLNVQIKVQRWKLAPCLLIIRLLLVLRAIDKHQAVEMAHRAVSKSLRICVPVWKNV